MWRSVMPSDQSFTHACLLCSARQIPPLGMHDELTTQQATPFVASDFIYLATVVGGGFSPCQYNMCVRQCKEKKEADEQIVDRRK